MFKHAKKDRSSRLIAFRMSLVAILACTFLLFSFNLISLVRQQNTVRDLSLSNLQSSAGRIAFELERRMQRLAEDSLSSDHFKSLSFGPGAYLSPEKIRALRQKFDDIKADHPIARHFFIFSNERLVYPRLTSPLALSPEDLIKKAKEGPAVEEFVALFKAAEREEARMSSPEQALELYSRAEKVGVPDRLSALAAFQAAQLLLHARGPAAAEGAYRELLKKYGDQYDQSETPYALSVVYLQEPLASKILDDYPATRIYKNLVNGRWDLSAQQVDDYLPRLEKRLGITARSRPDTDFLDQYALTKALGTSFQTLTAQTEFAAARALRLNDKSFQTYFIRLPEKSGQGLIAGFSVSMPWVRRQLLPQCTETELGGSQITAILDESPGAGGIEAETNDIFVPLQGIFPSYRLRIPAGAFQASAAAANRELWFLGLSVGMFLCILGMGTFMLLRVSRALQWFTLRSEFINGISHDLKTPLSLIRLYSETLADRDQDFQPEEQRSYIRIIARETERLSHMIENVLDYSQIEQGRRRYSMPPGDLAVTVMQTVEDYSEYLSASGFTVKTDIQSYLPAVKFSAQQVSQAVLNLMDNARKYSGPSTSIRVQVKHEGHEVVVEVQDYGPGIPQEEQDKIFEPFYRAPSASGEGGCGLGLGLVRHVMEAHGGRVEVQSQLGQGSRFRLHFPVVSTPTQSVGRQADKGVVRART